MRGPPARATLFPYTTLFRSESVQPVCAMSPVGASTDVATSLVWIALHQVAGLGSLAFAGRRSPAAAASGVIGLPVPSADRKSTRLNSSHLVISYAVFCLKKK